MTKFTKLELDISLLRTGDLICERMSYMPNAAAIRYFTNLGKPAHLKSPYNHIAMVVLLEGKPYIFEAVGSGTSKPEAAYTRLHNRKIAVRRPLYSLQGNQFRRVVVEYSAKGTKYDWKGTFWEQLIYQTTGYKKNKSEVEGDARLYCSEYYARVINRLHSNMYKDYYMVDPQDLYIDDRYETIFEGKADTKC